MHRGFVCSASWNNKDITQRIGPSWEESVGLFEPRQAESLCQTMSIFTRNQTIINVSRVNNSSPVNQHVVYSILNLFTTVVVPCYWSNACRGVSYLTAIYVRCSYGSTRTYYSDRARFKHLCKEISQCRLVFIVHTGIQKPAFWEDCFDFVGAASKQRNLMH